MSEQSDTHDYLAPNCLASDQPADCRQRGTSCEACAVPVRDGWRACQHGNGFPCPICTGRHTYEGSRHVRHLAADPAPATGEGAES